MLAELFNICLKESFLSDFWKVSLVVPIFKNVSERFTAKSYGPVSILSVVSKVFEIGLLITLRSLALLLIPSMVLGLLDQVQIF